MTPDECTQLRKTALDTRDVVDATIATLREAGHPVDELEAARRRAQRVYEAWSSAPAVMPNTDRLAAVRELRGAADLVVEIRNRFPYLDF